MQRILVMGPPGGGKSRLARHLGARLGLPVFHLDQAFWLPGWAQAPAEAFAAEVARLAGGPAWVIDGNYIETIASRFAVADTLIYLDPPAWLCLLRIGRRTLESYGQVRADAAAGCRERVDLDFLRFAWSWRRDRRPQILALVGRFAGESIMLRTAADHRQLMRRLR